MHSLSFVQAKKKSVRQKALAMKVVTENISCRLLFFFFLLPLHLVLSQWHCLKINFPMRLMGPDNRHPEADIGHENNLTNVTFYF
jgi:hypothetical protein